MPLSQNTSYATNPHIGIGLRAPHIEYFYHNIHTTNSLFNNAIYDNCISWLEIHPENYMLNRGVHYEYLQAISHTIPISLHAVGLSLGSTDGVDITHLQHLQDLVHILKPLYVSDHLSFSSFNNTYFNDLLPVYYDDAHLQIMVRNVQFVQEKLARPIAIENPSRYINLEQSFQEEGEFLSALQQQTNCHFLLDINNIAVCMKNMNAHDMAPYWQYYPLQHIQEIHLAGHIMQDIAGEQMAIDTHSEPIAKECWPLLQSLLPHIKHDVSYLVEWDSNIPDIDILAAQALSLKNFLIKTI